MSCKCPGPIQRATRNEERHGMDSRAGAGQPPASTSMVQGVGDVSSGALLKAKIANRVWPWSPALVPEVEDYILDSNRKKLLAQPALDSMSSKQCHDELTQRRQQEGELLIQLAWFKKELFTSVMRNEDLELKRRLALRLYQEKQENLGNKIPTDVD
jgi:hypothetical protein